MRTLFSVLLIVFLLPSLCLGMEDQKTLKSQDGFNIVTIPEKAPDFLLPEWDERIISQGGFTPSGWFWVVVGNSKDGIDVRSVVISKDLAQKPYFSVIVGVSYNGIGNPPDDTYYDEQFFGGGEPSNILIGPIPWGDPKVDGLFESLVEFLGGPGL